jgi:NAD(P)-dependent dehydrogenase (short-subunit alcohol dehydrogenase family)
MPVHLVTGASRGIGLELCRQLSAQGDQIIALVRRTRPELEAIDRVKIIDGVDIRDEQAISGVSARIGNQPIDTLIHCAGILRRESIEHLDLTTIRDQFEVNALGPLCLTIALLGHLRAGSKVAIITSRMGSVGDNSSGSRYGYRMSKAAVNIAGVSLARDLLDRGIAVAMLHPGYVRTDMTEGRGLVDAPEAAAGLRARIKALSLESSGGFWHANGERLPW